MGAQRSSALSQFATWGGFVLFIYLFAFSHIDWSHLAPIALGAFAICLAVDGVRVALGYAGHEGPAVLARVRWEIIAISAVGVAVSLAMVVVAVQRDGWGEHDRTALDIATGLCAGVVRYFMLLRFWRPREQAERRNEAS